MNKLARAAKIILNDIDPGAKVDHSAQFGGLRPVLERRDAEVYSENCYICRDPSYAAYGLPLCYPCPFCGGHVAADDSVCDACGEDSLGVLPCPNCGAVVGFDEVCDDCGYDTKTDKLKEGTT